MAVFSLSLIALLLCVPGLVFSRKWEINVFIFPSAFVFLLLVGSLFNIPSSPFLIISDGLHYESQAIKVSEWLLAGMSGELVLDRFKEGWPLLLGGIYFLIGPEPLVGILINSAILSFTILIIIRTSQLLKNKNPGWYVAILFLISPMVLTMGPSLGRESVYWLGAALLSLGGIYFLQKRLIPGAFSIIFGIASLILIRPSLGLVVIYACLIPLVTIFLFVNVTRKITRYFLIFISLSILMGSIPYTFGPFMSYVDNVSITREALIETASTGFVIEPNEAEISTNHISPQKLSEPPAESESQVDNLIEDIVVNIRTGLLSLPNILFGPFPNEVGFSLTWAYLVFSTLVWLIISISAILEMWKTKSFNWKYIIFHLIMVSGYLIVLAMTLTNYGIVARFRILAEVILLPWAANFLSDFIPKSNVKIMNLLKTVSVRKNRT